MHVRGVSSSLKVWDENSPNGEVCRLIVERFTSAFMNTFSFNDLTIHGSRIGSIRKTELKRRTTKGKKIKEKKRLQISTMETRVINVFPEGFKTSIRQA